MVWPIHTTLTATLSSGLSRAGTVSGESTIRSQMRQILKWKQVLDDLRVKLIYALSAAAKGKIERPYRWLA